MIKISKPAGKTTLTLRWKQGPAHATKGPVFVSITTFKAARLRDLPGVYLTGLRLRHGWPRRQGAVGLWLWARPWQLRSGSISVWEGEEDLRRFVQWPVHVAIMRAYRNRTTVTSDGWNEQQFDIANTWQTASERLADDTGEPATAAAGNTEHRLT